MALRLENPTTIFGAPTPSRLASMSDREQEARERATRRYKMASLAVETGGSWGQRRKAVLAAMRAGLIPSGQKPGRETVRQLVLRWQQGNQSLEDFYDAPRSGRPKVFMHSALERRLFQLLEGGTGMSVSSLLDELKAKAAELGIEQVPTYYQVHRAKASMSPIDRAAARHGSRAGEVDGVVHGRVPAKHTHDVWALDELTLPIWFRMWDRKRRRWRSVRADVILIVDVRSGVIVAYFIANPGRRVDATGEQALGGFDSDDVLAALLSAACRELAPNATRAFAGYLPRRLRWDNASAHKELSAWLTNDTTLSIDVRRIVKRRAKSNGAVERRVQTMKAWTAGILGHIDEYLPTDQVRSERSLDLGATRASVAGSTSLRMPRLQPIEPVDLLDYDGLCAAFDRVVYRYNHEHVVARQRTTHANLYAEHMPPRRPRNGMDLVRSLKPQTALAQGKGLVHHAHGREWEFTTFAEGLMALPGTALTYFVDPLMRGAFALYCKRLCFLRLAASHAENTDAATVARAQSGLSRAASDRAAASRRQQMAETLGPEAVEAAETSYAAEVERAEASARGERRPRPKPRHVPQPPEHDFPALPAESPSSPARGAQDAPTRPKDGPAASTPTRGRNRDALAAWRATPSTPRATGEAAPPRDKNLHPGATAPKPPADE